MEQQPVLFVSHCILNTAAKVQRAIPTSQTAEERERLFFLRSALELGVQLIQLPCPEFTLYGASRWGHTREQFDNPFFRDHCRHILAPILQQMRAYLQEREKFRVLGVVGIEGSPSCGVGRTCSGPWGGEFSGRGDLPQVLAQVDSRPGPGILMEVLREMMDESAIHVPVVGLDGRDPRALRALLDMEEEAAL